MHEDIKERLLRTMRSQLENLEQQLLNAEIAAALAVKRIGEIQSDIQSLKDDISKVEG